MTQPRSSSPTTRQALVIAAMTALTVAACGSDDADPSTRTPEPTDASPGAEVSAELQAIIDAANEEGRLELASAALLSQFTDYEVLLEKFQEYYPGLDIEVRGTPSGNQGETANKLREEAAAGQPAHTDVLGVTAGAVVSLVEDGTLRGDIDWAGLSNIQSGMIDTVYGASVEVGRYIHVVGYNSDVLQGDDIPQTTEDLLKPQHEGRIATTPFAGGFDVLMIEWGFEKTRDYIEQFSRQLGGQIGGGADAQTLVTGEFDLIAFLVGPGDLLQAQADGAPVDYAILNDAAMTYQLLLGIPSNSAHPNAARLWINFVMSPEVQALLGQDGFLDSPLLPGSVTGQAMEAAESAGATFINADVAWYSALDLEEYNENFTELVSIIRSGG